MTILVGRFPLAFNKLMPELDYADVVKLVDNFFFNGFKYNGIISAWMHHIAIIKDIKSLWNKTKACRDGDHN